jgi:hypothetical protein
MEPMDYWRLCDQLTVVQAALLVVGEDPSGDVANCEIWSMGTRPRGYEAAKSAISHALRIGVIKGTRIGKKISERYDAAGDLCDVLDDGVDPVTSIVEVVSLREWLTSRGFTSGFFFPSGSDAPGYLDPSNASYAPKLAAAIAVWQATTSDPGSTSGTSVKQAMLRWLRKHADQFGLTKDDGNPNEQGIEEVAKIANWDTKGGAPRTPGG